MSWAMALRIVVVLSVIPVHVSAAQWWTSVAHLASSHLDTNRIPKDRTVLEQSGMITTNARNNDFLSTQPFCGRLKGLSFGQMRICELFWDHMPSVGQGAALAIEGCQGQFQGSRWNCSTPYSSDAAVQPTMALATSESAYTYAIVASGVMHEISRACRRGELMGCGCNNEERPKQMNPSFHWGGCGDNVDYGYVFTKDFVDIREKEVTHAVTSPAYGQALMNRWNNEVGRKFLRRRSKPHCKCHGVSGACSVRTCWRQLPDLADVSESLFTKYEHARMVRVNSRGNLQLVHKRRHLRLGNKKLLLKSAAGDNVLRQRRTESRGSRTVPKVAPIKPLDLVYLDDSPDYCDLNQTVGSRGTQGRQCRLDIKGKGSCEMLCCGRGYDTFRQTITKKCNCNFQWCCKVVCEQCTSTTTTYICK